MCFLLLLWNRAIPLELLFKDITLEPEVSSPHRFKIQGSGGYCERAKQKKDGRKIPCLILDEPRALAQFPGRPVSVLVSQGKGEWGEMDKLIK